MSPNTLSSLTKLGRSNKALCPQREAKTERIRAWSVFVLWLCEWLTNQVHKQIHECMSQEQALAQRRQRGLAQKLDHPCPGGTDPGLFHGVLGATTGSVIRTWRELKSHLILFLSIIVSSTTWKMRCGGIERMARINLDRNVQISWLDLTFRQRGTGCWV